MDRTAVINKLTGIFRKVFEDNSLVLTDDMTANDVEQWVSLTHMLLITEIETDFAITLKLKDLNKMHTVGDMINIILSKFETQ